MPSVSPRQHRTMEAAKHDPAFAKKVGIPQKVARDFVTADKRGDRFASGGAAPMANEPIHLGGLVAGHDAGRADTIPCSVPQGSYIIPADVCASYGQGNTTRGAKLLDRVFNTPALVAHPASPRLPMVPVKLSSGEYVIHPAAVAKLGGGNLKHGHDILDKFVVQARAKHVKELKSLPGPVGAKP